MASRGSPCTSLLLLALCVDAVGAAVDDATSLVQTRHVDKPVAKRTDGKALDETAATAISPLVCPMHDESDIILTVNGRGRLGNRLFQWAALLSIAKELGARAIITEDELYKVSSTPQMTKLAPLVWSRQNFTWLSGQPSKCHVWDRPPAIVDSGIDQLGMFKNWMGERGKYHTTGEKDIQDQLQPGNDWAKPFAQAIKETRTPAPCRIIELDGFFQQQWFFQKHIEWLRAVFWNTDYEGHARDAIDHFYPDFAAPDKAFVGIHFRLTDYLLTNRNLPLDYYLEATQEVKKQAPEKKLMCVVFSDDVSMALGISKALTECSNITAVVDPKIDDKVSFYMLGLMPNIILADSSYSFWAARLSPFNPTVVAPFVHHESRQKLHADTLFLQQTPGWKTISTTTGKVDANGWHSLGFSRRKGPISEWSA